MVIVRWLVVSVAVRVSVMPLTPVRIRWPDNPATLP